MKRIMGMQNSKRLVRIDVSLFIYRAHEIERFRKKFYSIMLRLFLIGDRNALKLIL